MEDLELLKEEIKDGRTIQLSSNFTKGGSILGALVAVIAAFFLVPIIQSNQTGLETRTIIGGLLLLLLVFATFYQLIFAAKAELTGRNLKLKKVIGTAYEIDISQIVGVSTFHSKNTKYTTVKFKDNNGNPQKVLILNSNSVIFGEEVAAGDVIKLAQQIM
jgi:hypothetical protein